MLHPNAADERQWQYSKGGRRRARKSTIFLIIERVESIS